VVDYGERHARRPAIRATPAAPKERPIMLRIAVAQTPGSRLDRWPQTLEVVEDLIEQAASRNADLVLLPECVWPAYFIGSTDAYFAARQRGMPSDRWFVAQLVAWARAHRISICAGYVAEEGRRLFNAASLIGESGELLGTYRKCFLWDFDHEFFEAGDALTPIETRWGPLGIIICADARMPEIAGTLAARGIRLILQPTAWVNCGLPDQLWNPQPELLLPERAREIGVPTASASKWGVEGAATFVGSSVICDAAGRIVAQCGTSETKLAIAEVALGTSRPPQMTDAQRARLLSTQAAELPAADVPPLQVALLNDVMDAETALESTRQLNASSEPPPTLLLLSSAPSAAAGADQPRGDNWLLLTRPTDVVHALGNVRVAAVRERDTYGFAPLRALAFGGIHLAVVFGDNVSARTLRSRAAENRIFLVHVIADGIRAYDPRGQPAGTARAYNPTAANGGKATDVLTLDVAQAADKEFAPRTNPFTQRRPSLYAF
jgi:predicted amidohydrolase